MSPSPVSRRRFLATLGAGAAAFAAARTFAAQSASAAGSEPARRLGVCLVGLGSYSTEQLAPALALTRHAHLTAVVTGTPAKAANWKARHRLTDDCIYDYASMDRLRDNPAVDIVYVVTPPGLHEEHTIRAARAGKHVICEKPMAPTAAACERMVTACRDAGVRLGIGYRLHYDPFHLEAARLARDATYGAVRSGEAVFSYRIGRWGGWRLDPALAGEGPLWDIGVYTVQAAHTGTQAIPVAVAAAESLRSDQGWSFAIPEGHAYALEFPDGTLFRGRSSYREQGNRMRVAAERGSWEISPAYGYNGLRGTTPSGPLSFPTVNQQALQIDAFARHVLLDEPNLVPGEMGLRDIRVLEAVVRSAREGTRIPLS